MITDNCTPRNWYIDNIDDYGKNTTVIRNAKNLGTIIALIIKTPQEKANAAVMCNAKELCDWVETIVDQAHAQYELAAPNPILSWGQINAMKQLLTKIKLETK